MDQIPFQPSSSCEAVRGKKWEKGAYQPKMRFRRRFAQNSPCSRPQSCPSAFVPNSFFLRRDSSRLGPQNKPDSAAQERISRGFARSATRIEIATPWARSSRATSDSTARHPPPSPANAPPPRPSKEVTLFAPQIYPFPGRNLRQGLAPNRSVLSWLEVWLIPFQRSWSRRRRRSNPASMAPRPWYSLLPCFVFFVFNNGAESLVLELYSAVEKKGTRILLSCIMQRPWKNFNAMDYIIV